MLIVRLSALIMCTCICIGNIPVSDSRIQDVLKLAGLVSVHLLSV